jgi:hypothetical protein
VRKRKEVTKDNKINILVDGETRFVNYTLHVCYCTSIAHRSYTAQHHTPSVSISLQVRKRKEVTKDNTFNILVDGETVDL